MRRGVVAFSALALVGLGITGCGLSRFEQREPWRAQTEEACIAQKLVTNTAYMSAASEIDGPGVCGMTRPFKVAAFGDGTVGLSTRATLACPIIPRIDGWLNEVVQPAASTHFGTAVVEVKSGSYSCRARNNQRSGRYSEHAFGNALDVMAFRLSDGREISVVKGWRGAPEEQDFLREVLAGACQHFTTVLGPGADAFHYDHFHLDLARHDPRGERRICKPAIKVTPRLEAGTMLTHPSAARPRIERMPSSEPLDIGEEEDPFEAAPVSRRSGPEPTVARLPPPAPGFSPPPPRPSVSSAPQAWTGRGIY
jgi:hypothetical protein